MRVPPNHSSHGWPWLSIYGIVMETFFFWWQNPDGCNFKIFKLPYSPQQIVDFPSRKNTKNTSILSQETTIPVLKSSIWSNFPKSPKKSDKSRIILKKNTENAILFSVPRSRSSALHSFTRSSTESSATRMAGSNCAPPRATRQRDLSWAIWSRGKSQGKSSKNRWTSRNNPKKLYLNSWYVLEWCNVHICWNSK